MNHWVMAFVGNHAQENHEITQRTKTFCVSSTRTPIRRVNPGDRALLYLAGIDFVGRGEISSPARAPNDAPEWYSKNLPMWQTPIENIEPFPQQVPYEFPAGGNHPTLGFHQRSLTSGFLAIPEDGFEDVISRATPRKPPVEEPATRPAAPERRASEPVLSGAVGRQPTRRVAGQHAPSQGRRRVASWTVAEMGASLLGLEGVKKLARERAQAAQKT